MHIGGGRDRRQWLRHMPIFHKVGCTVLSIDCQEHGLSDGKGRRIGWATYERSDAVAAAYHAKHVLGYERVILMGKHFCISILCNVIINSNSKVCIMCAVSAVLLMLS
jgi:hypothetical protein